MAGARKLAMEFTVMVPWSISLSHTTIGVQLWDYTRMMSMFYYDRGFEIMLALFGIPQKFDKSGMEMLYLDHFFVLIIHSSGEWLVQCLINGITKVHYMSVTAWYYIPTSSQIHSFMS